MQVIGIIFFACLAFAVAILILITCCFYKVNSGKDFIRDPEVAKAETIRRINEIAHNKSVDEEKPKQSPNVILFIHKNNKRKYSDSKRNHYQSNSGDGLGIGNFNDGFCQGDWGHHSNDIGYDDTGPTDAGCHGGDGDGDGAD